MPRFRPWQLAALLVVLCGVVIGIAMYLRRAVDLPPRQMAAYMPHTDSTFIYVDLRPLRESGLLERIAGSAIGEEDEYKNFVARTGFDYKSDLDAVLSAAYRDTTYILARGRFDWKGLIDYTSKQGGVCRTGFCRIPSSHPNRTVSFRAISPNLLALAVGPDEWAAAQIKAPASQAPLMDVPVQPVWAVIPGSSLHDRESVPTGTKLFAKALENADRVVLALGPEQGRFSVDLDAVCKTEADAIALRSQLEGITELLDKLIHRENQQPNATDLSGILVRGSFTRVDRHVMGKWPVPREFVDNLASGS